MSLMLKHQQQIKEDGVVGAGMDPGHGDHTKHLAMVAAGSVGVQQLAELVSNALGEDLKALKDVKSIERKVQLKREDLVPKYAGYVARLRADNVRHEMLAQYMVWLFDIEDIEAAMDLGFHCLDAGIPLPERFKRDVPTYLADAVLEWAERQYEAERTAEPYFTNLFEFVRGDHADPWDLPDKLRAKYYRLHGLFKERGGDFAGAVASLEKAMAMGQPVKTILAKARKSLKAEAAGE